MGPAYMLMNYVPYLFTILGFAVFAGQEFNIYDWFATRYLAGEMVKVSVGVLTYIIQVQYLLPYSIFLSLTAVFSAVRSLFSAAISKLTRKSLSKELITKRDAVKAELDKTGKLIGVMNFGAMFFMSPVFKYKDTSRAVDLATGYILNFYDWFSC